MLISLRPKFLSILYLLGTLFLSAGGAAQAEESLQWQVVVASEATIIHGDATSVALSPGTAVMAGDRLATGAGGAVVLARGEDLITMAENSQIAIVDPQPNAATLIKQPFGSVQYHVTKQPHPHFEVDTPLLATIVKGTTFDIQSGSAESAVAVSEGRVLARDLRGGGASPVAAGEIGRVTEAGLPGVNVKLGRIQKAARAAMQSDQLELSTGVSAAEAGMDGSGGGSTGQGSLGHSVGGLAGAVGGAVNAAVGGVAGAVGDAVAGVGRATGHLARGVAQMTGGALAATGQMVDKTLAAPGSVATGVVNATTGLVDNLLGGQGSASSGGGSTSGGTNSGGAPGGAPSGESGSAASGSSGGSASSDASSNDSESGGSSPGSGGSGGELGSGIGGALKGVADRLGGLL